MGARAARINPTDRDELLRLAADKTVSRDIVGRVRALYEKAEVFEQAEKLVDKYQERAESIADEVQPDELRRLLDYLIDTVLERPTAAAPPIRRLCH